MIPRSGSRWVFGSAVGVADGAWALWQRREHPAGALWLTTTHSQAEQARAQGIPSVRAASWRGFWATARAGVIVITHGFGDVNRFATGGAFIVQLWHGIPLKRLGLDSPATTRPPFLPHSRVLRGLLRAAYRRAQAQIDLLPAASHLVRGRLETAFGLDDERVVVTGEPRVDVLSPLDPVDARARARETITALVGDLPAQLLVLYAPTWRDGADDPAVPTPAQWHELHRALEAVDAVLLVRSHPLGAGAYDPRGASDRVRLIGADVVPDITPLLHAVDLLVTDYSSLMYDVGLLSMPVIHLAPDVESYARERGFYGTYADVTGGREVRTWSDAAARLVHLRTDAAAWAEARERSAALSARVHAFTDGHNAARVLARVDDAIGRAGS